MFLPCGSMLGLFLAAAASSRRQVPKNHLLSIIFWDLHGNQALLNQDCHKTPGLTRSPKLDRDLEREGWSMTCPFRLDDSVLGGDPSRLESFLITNIIIWVIRSSYYWHKGVTPMWSSSRSLRSPAGLPQGWSHSCSCSPDPSPPAWACCCSTAAGWGKNL